VDLLLPPKDAVARKFTLSAVQAGAADGRPRLSARNLGCGNAARNADF
jgi:hypothetical protein